MYLLCNGRNSEMVYKQGNINKLLIPCLYLSGLYIIYLIINYC